ncbi:hypothetical protein CPT_Mendera_065 [Stenotrophomonas phage Mendera]|uniref:Bacteriophage T4 Gp59 helicase assembly protein N-terminal domain-containing protein n=5 Tax=Menderavirus TaxID=2843421 RepID=A0A0H4INW4_9CAUD|nr:hypothetical protein HWC11_gp070 [Stenotrophomonas phage YB07]YP_009850772.1 helicase loader [Stenotrophomonas phage Moby]YP_009851122.1 hypothetical protein HWC60_gp065 [Stenotrophomonas phage Mendera]YP_010077905.1 hypothetical protein KMC40_gp046 [Stenotrophomonas phage IME-SM1]YP_010667642.1 helicase loading protein [Stenotrophomonas maltophilia phage vB_SmaM_Ps15]QXN67438.1 hypothetical protein [Stenotrophomonas phage BUCT608]QYW02613.1 DnaC-like helicase loader [Stenotrophomonas phag
MYSRADSHSVLSGAVQAFQEYVGLKLHFNKDLVWRRGMRFNQDESTLLKRKDAMFFRQFADKYPDSEDRIQRYVSALKRDQNAWIGEMLDMENVEYHKQRMRVIGALTYNLRTDIDRLVTYMDENGVDIKKLLKSDGTRPYLITVMSEIEGGISDETLALMEKAFRYCKQETLDPFWEQKAFMLSKYHYWLEIKSDTLDQQLSRLVEAGKA